MSDPAENRDVRGNTIKPHQVETEIPIKQPYISIAAVMNIVGQNVGTGLTFDSDKKLINATSSSGINRQNVAESFTEATVSTSLDSLEAKNGSLEILGPYGDTITLTDEIDLTDDNGGVYGAKVNPNKPLEGFKVATGDYFEENNEGSYSVTLEETDGTQLDTATYDTTTDEIELNASLSAGVDYYILIDTSGDYTYHGQYGTTTADSFDVTGGYKNSSESFPYVWKYITPVISSSPSGSGTIEWAGERDVNEWQTATYQESPDGESVDVFVAYNDGSGWTRTNGGNPISRGYDLSADSNIDPDYNVRIETEISRNDGSNNPRLDAAYLSWTV